MHFLRLATAALLACASLVAAAPAKKHPKCPHYCKGTTNSSMSDAYVCGDPRLGPTQLPTKMPLSVFVTGYHRLGGLCPGEFLANWTDPKTSSYNYPPDNGFQLDTGGNPIMGNMTLTPGMLIDRFGSYYGSFLAPYGSPYDQRALPPSNLDTPAGDPTYPYNYHVYKVLMPFDVFVGPIAAWFGQPGQGTQYELINVNVMTLQSGGYLKELPKDEYP